MTLPPADARPAVALGEPVNAFVENVLRRHGPRFIADAEALLQTAARCDLPGGCRIIQAGSSEIAGVSIGTGRALAQAHGFTSDTVAVCVALDVVVALCLEWIDDPAIVLRESAVLIETVAAHEVAHALTQPADVMVSAESLRRLTLTAAAWPAPSPVKLVRDHCPRWAAANLLIASRCSRFRPLARQRWHERIAGQLAFYGFDSSAVADALGDVGDESSVRDLLAPGSVVSRRVESACPAEAERLVSVSKILSCPDAELSRVAAEAAGLEVLS